MTPDNDAARDAPIFSAVITPHRSLNQTGFLVLMWAVAAVSFVAGLTFLIAGAWPVFGFFGLDVLLIWWAFRANYRAAAAYEQVTVTASEVTVRKVCHRGRAREWSFNPLWVRLDRETIDEFGLQALFLVSRERRLAIAGHLAPDEKESFAGALSAALGEARRGPTRTVFS
jgi:uncharacterized membrane protein